MESVDRLTAAPTALPSPQRATRLLLACGVAVAPFFYLVAIARILTRPGFDIRVTQSAC